MPKGSHIEFFGGDRAIADIERWAKEVGPLIAKDRDLAGQLRSEVAGDVPYVTGLLSSTVSEFDEDSGWSVGYDGGADYDGWIEFGGSRGRALVPEGRWLYPIAATYEEEFVASATDIAQDLVGDFAWSTPSA
jgi:hypothetical protein